MHTVENPSVFITGGSGFVGRHIVEALGDRSIRALVHRNDDPLEHRPNVDTVRGSVTDRESLRGSMEGCDTVIHLVAIIEESAGSTFDSVIHQGTEHVVDEAIRAGVKRFIYMSANGARDESAYAYLKAKWDAEQDVLGSGLTYTIFRPSVIFGPGDGFISTLAGVVKSFPVIPVVGDGTSTFQPVHVNEVADAFVRALDDPDATSNDTFELGGPRVYTYAELLDAIAAELGTSKPKVHVPVGLMMPIVKLSSPLPKALRPPVTTEQLKMLAIDNTTPDSATAFLIGREPTRLEDRLSYVSNRG